MVTLKVHCGEKSTIFPSVIMSNPNSSGFCRCTREARQGKASVDLDRR